MLPDGPWDGVDPLIRESRRWLEDRLPEGLEPNGEGYCYCPSLHWTTSRGGLILRFDTPHRVRWERFYQGRIDRYEGTFNLAMNLAEITDLIRDTMEPK